MAKKIIGRAKEQRLLSQWLYSEKSEFLALYGRRRIGKTFLVKNFFMNENCVFFYCSGIQAGNRATQLEEFATQIGESFYQGAPITPRKRWRDAFIDLCNAIAKIPPRKKVVLFFDELPWMATPRSGLLQTIDYYWNRYWSHDPRIKLVVCGSSASWIIKKIINNKGGLYNRVTRIIQLAPFSLAETEAFLAQSKIYLTQQQILSIYMVFGGIPHYLNLITKGLSAEQCIDLLCFQKSGELVYEFDRLFASLFNDADLYTLLIKTIAKHPYGLALSELNKTTGIADGGRTKQRLQELEQAGFILEFVPYGNQEKGIYYKVIDEFSLFYLRWIAPNIKKIAKQQQANGYWLSKTQSPQWKAWSGLAFESVCYKQLDQIRQALQIAVGAEIGSWRYSPRKKQLKGAQIDLLFDRNDDAITVCEIKHNDKPFVIDKAYAENLLNKLKVYRQKSKTTKQLFLAMITVNGVKPTLYSEEIVDGVVSLNDLFVSPKCHLHPTKSHPTVLYDFMKIIKGKR